MKGLINKKIYIADLIYRTNYVSEPLLNVYWSFCFHVNDKSYNGTKDIYAYGGKTP